jgi:hypothetical protein
MTGINPYLFCRSTAEAEHERTYKSITEPSHPGTITLLDAWKRADAEGGFVVGRDVPSRSLATVLRDLILYEPVLDSLNFRVRLAGTVCIAHYGMDITGKLMSELFDAPTFEFNVRSGWNVIQTAEPRLFAAELSRLGIVLHHYEIALLPVWSPDRNDRWLLCGVFKFD